MTRRADTLTQSRVARAVKGALAGGAPVGRVEVIVDASGFRVVCSPIEADAAPARGNEWDEVLAK